MPFDQRQTELLQAHLLGMGLVCPACQHQQWQLVEVISLPADGAAALTNPKLEGILRGATGTQPTYLVPSMFAGKAGQVLPVAVVACTNCFFLMTFAWRPIVEQSLRTAFGGQKL